jgi:protein-tyrosine-phosphatase
MAVALLRHMLKEDKGMTLFSRGIYARSGQSISDGARQALLDAGVQVEPHRSQPLDKKNIEKADLVFVMTQDQLDHIVSRYPKAKHKIRRLADTDIADPIGGSPSDYEKCRIEIQNALLDVITELKSEGSSKS